MFKGVFRSPADAFKIIASYIIGGTAIGYCLYAAATDGSRPVLQVLVCILGGAIGWCVGLYLTPSSESERKQLSEASKVLLTLLSGFGLGKAGQIADAVRSWLPANEDSSATRILLFFCTLLIGALFTYISRLFVKGSEESQRSERAKTIAELKATLAKLEQQNQ